MSNNTIEILSSIHKSVLQIVSNMAPQNGSDTKSVSNLNKGGSAVVSTDSGPNINVSTDSVKGVVKVLSELSPAIKDIAGLSGGAEKKFKSVIKNVIDAMEMLNEKASKFKSKEISESIKGLTNVATITHTLMKNMSSWIILAPLALLGATLAIPAFVMMGLLFKIVKLMGIDEKTVKSMKNITKGINEMMGIVFKMILLTVIMVGLGYLLMNGETGKLILGGLMVFGIVCVMLIAVILLTSFAANFAKAFGMNALKDMMFLIIGMTLILAVFVGFAVLVEEHWEYVWQGFGMFGLTLLALTAVIGLAAWASKVITNEAGINSLKTMLLVIGGAMGLIVASKYLADFVQENWEGVLIGLGSTGLVVAGIIGLAFLADKMKSTALKGALAIAVITGIAYAAMGVIFLASKLSDETKGKWGDITLSLLGVTGVILLFVGLAAAASFVAPYITIGGATLWLIVGFVAATLGVTAALIGFHLLKEESGVGWDDIYTDVLGLAGVIGIFGILTAAIGLVAPLIGAGTLACGALVLFTMGATNITRQIITLRKVITDGKTNWSAIFNDIKQLAKVIGAFALIATAMTVALIPITLGLAAMAMTKRFAQGAISIALQVAELAIKIKEAGGSSKLVSTVNSDMRKVLRAFTKGNLTIPLSIFDIWDLRKQYNAIGGLVQQFVKVGTDISRLARIAGVVDEQGRISPVLKVTEDGNIIYGDPVDIKAIAQVIVDTIKIFTSELTDGMCSVREMLNAGIVVMILGQLTDPINRFVEMLTGYKSFNEGELAKITIKEDGTVKIGEPVKIKDVADIIAGAITTFINGFLSDENVGRWSTLLYGEGYTAKGWFDAWRNRSCISLMTTILSSLIDPIVKFIDMIAAFDVSDDGKMSKITIKDDGTVIIGPKVDMVKSATALGTVITNTLSAIFNEDSLTKMKNIPTIPDGTYEKIENRMAWMERISQLVCDDTKKYDSAENNAIVLGNAFNRIINIFDGDGGMFINNIKMTNTVECVKKMLEHATTIQNLKGENIKKNSNDIKTFFSVVTKEMQDDTPIWKDFNVAVIRVKNSISSFNEVLIGEQENRKKAIDEFKSSMSELMEVFKDENGTISNLSTLISNLSTLNKSKVSENADELRKAINKVKSGGSGGSGGNSGSNGSSGTTTVEIDYDQITEAVKSAIDSMRMNKFTLTKSPDGETRKVVELYEFVVDN